MLSTEKNKNNLENLRIFYNVIITLIVDAISKHFYLKNAIFFVCKIVVNAIFIVLYIY